MIARIILSIFFLFGILQAAPIVITNKDDQSFLAEIIRVDDEIAEVKRFSDGKEFQLSFDILDQKTKDLLIEWEKANRVWPFQEVKAETTLGKVTIDIPEGDINIPHRIVSYVDIKYNSGRINIVFSRKGGKDSIERWKKDAVPMYLGQLKPDKRKLVEKTTKIEKRKAGKWITYRLSGDFAYHIIRFINGDEHGYITIYTIVNGREISLEEAYRIVSSIQISD